MIISDSVRCLFVNAESSTDLADLLYLPLCPYRTPTDTVFIRWLYFPQRTTHSMINEVITHYVRKANLKKNLQRILQKRQRFEYGYNTTEYIFICKWWDLDAQIPPPPPSPPQPLNMNHPCMTVICTCKGCIWDINSFIERDQFSDCEYRLQWLTLLYDLIVRCPINSTMILQVSVANALNV